MAEWTVKELRTMLGQLPRANREGPGFYNVQRPITTVTFKTARERGEHQVMATIDMLTFVLVKREEGQHHWCEWAIKIGA